jgi:hypothetical protein
MKLESGPAAYDRNYWLIFLLACLAFSAYFFYDYKIGYPQKNIEEAKKQLSLQGDPEPAEFRQTPTEATFNALQKSAPTDPAVIHEKFGPPLVVKHDNDRTFEYFVSAYGMAEVPIVGDRVLPEKMAWRNWYKSRDEVMMQLYCALAALALALYVAYRVYRASTLRATIDDEGMTYGGRRIAFENVVRLCDYSPKGWVDLYYKHGPQERRLRIDNQKIRKFDEIIDTLCEIKGFDDPRALPEEPEAAETAGSSDEPGVEERAGTDEPAADEQER